MALADMQWILTRVVTTPEVRRRLRTESENFTQDKDPLKEAIRAVMNIPPRQLTHYAEALVNKRCRAVGKCLPATLRMLGQERFRERFRVHATETWPVGPGRHREDAIAFADKIRRTPEPEWTDEIIDLAAYEAATLRATRPTLRIVALLMRYTPQDLINAVASEQRGAGLTRRLTLVVWIRLWKGGPPKAIWFSMPQSRPMPRASATRLM